MVKRKRKTDLRAVKRIYHLYVLLINGVVRGVGQSTLTPAQRQGCHRTQFAAWLVGYVKSDGVKMSEHGYYEFLKRFLMGIKWQTKTEKANGISWRILDGPREMTGHEADRLEDEYIQKYSKTTLNKVPGGIGGKGSTRQARGSKLAKTYGSIYYEKSRKKYRVYNARINGGNPFLGYYNTLNEAYAVLKAAYDDVKYKPHWNDIAPKPLAEYQNYLFKKHGLSE